MLFALRLIGYAIAAAGAHDNVRAGGFDPDFDFDGVDAACRMIRRIKAQPVLMAQLLDYLPEGLFQICHFAVEITPGGNLRQSPQKIHRFFIALRGATCSSLPLPVSVRAL